MAVTGHGIEEPVSTAAVGVDIGLLRSIRREPVVCGDPAVIEREQRVMPRAGGWLAPSRRAQWVPAGTNKHGQHAASRVPLSFAQSRPRRGRVEAQGAFQRLSKR